MSDQGTSEAMQVAVGLEQNDESPWEYGLYVERNDGRDGKDGWTPLVYGGCVNYEDAVQCARPTMHSITVSPRTFRNPRIVRRAVSPWEVVGEWLIRSNRGSRNDRRS